MYETTNTQTTPQDETLVLSVQNLRKVFLIMGGLVAHHQVADLNAVDDVSFDIRHRETSGLACASGCVSPTFARCYLRLVEPSSGKVQVNGADIVSLSPSDMHEMRRHLQVIFQDPYGTLRLRRRVKESIIDMTSGPRRERVQDMLDLAGLNAANGKRYPHQLSGGQRQCVVVARALALKPEVVLLDEPVSALDVSVLAGVLKLLRDIQEKMQTASMFVAHDLSVVQRISHMVAIMYVGRFIETARTANLFARPKQPYLQALMSALLMAAPTLNAAVRKIWLRAMCPTRPIRRLVACSAPFASRRV